LPGAARQAGLFVGKARRYIEGVRSEVESELDIGEFKRMLHNQEVQINELQQQIKSGVDDIKSDLPDVNSGDLLNEAALNDPAPDDAATHTMSDEVPEHTGDDADSEQTASAPTAASKPRSTD
jgi:sec-independent protein translocase protein TatB